jgi:hypothetical protein
MEDPITAKMLVWYKQVDRETASPSASEARNDFVLRARVRFLGEPWTNQSATAQSERPRPQRSPRCLILDMRHDLVPRGILDFE